MANRNQEQFVHIDARTAADMRLRGVNPHEMELSTQAVVYYVYASLPAPPVYAAARLSALPASPSSSDGVDRISALPFELLRDIVSRLPVKDAARTAAISRRWRPVWRCSPLVFTDAHLVPASADGRRRPARADTPGVVQAVTRVLAAHPGPFRSVHLLCGFMDAHQRQLASWVQTLAAKGVQELVLVNRPFPRDVPLPAALLGAATLTRLRLGLWKFPDTSALPRRAGPAFPHLIELFFCAIDVESRNMDFLLAGSPALEILGIMGNKKSGMRLRLVGQRLRCVQISRSMVESIAVVDTPSLERLFLFEPVVLDGSCIRLKIGNAPKLRLFGYLDPTIYMLEIGNTVINAGIKASPSIMATGVRILGLNECFGVRSDAKMLATFLRCFPSVETLRIVSAKTRRVTGKVSLKFWKDAGPIKSIRSCIKAMTFREFQLEQSEIAFLKFFFQTAQVVKNVVVVVAMGSFISIPEVISKMKTLIPENGPSDSCYVRCESSDPEADVHWSFRRGCDFSVSDPFPYGSS